MVAFDGECFFFIKLTNMTASQLNVHQPKNASWFCNDVGLQYSTVLNISLFAFRLFKETLLKL